MYSQTSITWCCGNLYIYKDMRAKRPKNVILSQARYLNFQVISYPSSRYLSSSYQFHYIVKVFILRTDFIMHAESHNTHFLKMIEKVMVNFNVTCFNGTNIKISLFTSYLIGVLNCDICIIEYLTVYTCTVLVIIKLTKNPVPLRFW